LKSEGIQQGLRLIKPITLMIKLIPFLIFGTLVGTAVAQSPAQVSESFYQQGQAAEKTGDPAAAKEFYAKALKANPKNANAIYSAGQLKINVGTISAKGREAKFGAVPIPAFQLDEATLQEALGALGTMVEKQSNEEVAPNFVVEDPKNLLGSKKITLNLKGINAQAALKYVLDQVGAKVRHDEHAVVILPR
jgi:tetratricopeptide (TPR) repeat protein